MADADRQSDSGDRGIDRSDQRIEFNGSFRRANFPIVASALVSIAA
jgi:hypothetical protein